MIASISEYLHCIMDCAKCLIYNVLFIVIKRIHFTHGKIWLLTFKMVTFLIVWALLHHRASTGIIEYIAFL